MTVYDWLAAIAGTELAQSIRIDLSGKALFVNGEPIIARGRMLTPIACLLPDPGYIVSLEQLIVFNGNPYEEIERLYAQFKRSVPSKRDRLDKGNFKAVSSDQLSYQELESNMPRQEARLLLEGFVMLAASTGLLQWKYPAHFYWQGNDPDLILYREWVM